jgi:hypothetical protein
MHSRWCQALAALNKGLCSTVSVRLLLLKMQRQQTKCQLLCWVLVLLLLLLTVRHA